MMAASMIDFLSLAIWLVLLFGRGFFWLARERDDRDEAPPPHTGRPWLRSFLRATKPM